MGTGDGVDSKTSNADVTSFDKTCFRFAIANLIAGVLFYPCLCCIAIFVFWSNDVGFAATLALGTVLHMFVFWGGLVVYRRTSPLLIPWLIAVAFVFLFNRHSEGRPDNSPFSDGVGTVGQQIWGMTGYYRVFDDPAGQFGRSYFDWAAVFPGIELSMIITIVIAMPAVAIFGQMQRVTAEWH